MSWMGMLWAMPEGLQLRISGKQVRLLIGINAMPTLGRLFATKHVLTYD